MKKQTVYVPVHNGIPVVIDRNFDPANYVRRFGNFNALGYYVVPVMQLYCEPDKDGHVAITRVLEQKENAYIFTEQELLELKKKWADEAFEAGGKETMDYLYHTERGLERDPKIPTKEQYLNNLKID